MNSLLPSWMKDLEDLKKPVPPCPHGDSLDLQHMTHTSTSFLRPSEFRAGVSMIFLALYACEAGIFLALLSLYRAATRSDIWSFLRSNAGWMFLCSSILIISSLGWAIHMVRKCAPTKIRTMYLWMGMNLVMLVLMLGSVEILARVLSKQVGTGQIESGQVHRLDERLLGRILYPQQWSQFSANTKMVIDRMVHEGSYLAQDRILGWTITPSRRDETGQYLSSAEGLRSPRVGMSFADLRVRHTEFSEQPASVRIALMGDSFTFGLEVRCEESWGHALEGLLQSHAQVLNFGVSAYGLEQAFLRYEKDARAWKPQIVIISIINEMITRVNNIYPFLQNPEWNVPFARPMLAMTNDSLTPINAPLPDPGQIFSRTAITELPYLDLDDYYRAYQWERGGMWHLLEKSYFFRFAYSFRAPTDDRNEERTQKALQMSQFVIQDFVREVLKDGAVPLVVYFPTKNDLLRSAEPLNTYEPLAVRMLRNAGIKYFDPTDCLIRIEASDAYMKGGHYSPPANTQIARCLAPVLREMLGEPKR